MRAAYQGEQGAYSEDAILKCFGGHADPLPRPLLRDVFDSVVNGEADLGMVPVENTIEGSVNQALDLLLEFPLKIQGEYVLRIVHCLIANLGVSMNDIGKVYSHPQALGQCRAFLEKHGLEAVVANDTAGSVRVIRDLKVMDAAAIASCRAAEVYGMKVLAQGIETNPENFTRFLIIGRSIPPPSGLDKTSIAFSFANKHGSIVKALRCLTDRGINLTSLQTRPMMGKPWEYVYNIDFEGHVYDPRVNEALEELEAWCVNVKILGSYPRATKPNA